MAMGSIVVEHRPSDEQRAAIDRLLEIVADHDAAQPLSDHLRMDLRDAASETYVGLLWSSGDGTGELAGYAQLQHGNGVWSLEVVVDPRHRDDTAGLAGLVGAATAEIARLGGGAVNWWVLPAGLGGADVAAATAGTAFTLGRELHQMRRPLPVEQTTDVSVRPFVVGRDEQAWLTGNNRAFATHPE